MRTVDRIYTDCLNDILTRGTDIQSRNSKTKRLMNSSMTFTETPLVSVRSTAWKNAIREFEWFLSGSNNINDLHPSVHKWWKPWANEAGYIHNNYSKQFRNFDGHGHNGGAKYIHSVDQIQYMLETLTLDPGSRRNVITTWHTHDMISPNTPITNCHGSLIQLFVDPDNKVYMTMYQRSCDMILGVPHNIIQYWAFLMWLCHRSGREVGGFNWIGGDCHIYESHIELAEEMIEAVEKFESNPPKLIYTPTSEDFKADDFTLSGDYKVLLKKSAKMIV